MDDTENQEFDRLMNGLLYSLLSWQQLTEFWQRIDRNAGWYIYAVGEPVPGAPAPSSQVDNFISKVDALLRHDHRENYCGIVYADDLDRPNFIKIYDPNNLGVSCGSSKHPPLPGWIMSRAKPCELQPRGVIAANRRRWWQSLFSPE
jgi:hypothetical protein